TELEQRAQHALQSFHAHDLDFDYRLGTLAAQGGMAKVFSAANASGNRFAIKIPHAVGSKSILRFDRERQALALFNEDAICRRVAYGMTGRKPGLVLEWIAGQPLPAIVEAMRSGGFNRREKLLLVRLLFQKIAAGVEVVHARGLVHRDLTPGNFLFTKACTA